MIEERCQKFIQAVEGWRSRTIALKISETKLMTELVITGFNKKKLTPLLWRHFWNCNRRWSLAAMEKVWTSCPWTRPRWAHRFSSSRCSCPHIVNMSVSENPWGDLNSGTNDNLINLWYQAKFNQTCRECKNRIVVAVAAKRWCWIRCRDRRTVEFCDRRIVRRRWYWRRSEGC